ncbi:hypothetical protein BN159_4784 [Streptomyces davaonensis JCM 4913]|uniref:Secreted protein n=1 Tax=Streptomyces davaonensis (strain DSM 101723 / JCM 4913 / KCC S-0913 / 768) TaxID=1214101 RepID=K4R722_STRDJ|nr:DUF2993 domain-containing protein [Streptomyces davaonensis]CCK29163.1 hypothetical protein BN159_4784 [Streptomyces davaonensis JCM 4913]
MRTPHHTVTHPAIDPYEELAELDKLGVRAFESEDDEDDEDDWAPPNHRRGGRRRRRRGRLAALPFATKAVIGLLAVTAFLTLADRWALLYAEHRAADALKDRMNLTAAPEVDIGGFPFLTQLAGEQLESVRITVPDVAADQVSLAKVTATAKDVRLTADGPTSLRGFRIPEMDGDVLLSFADLNRELGASRMKFTAHGRNRILARGTLPVAGHDLRLRAEVRMDRDGTGGGLSTEIGGIRLDIGELATYRPGTRPSQGLHLTRTSATLLSKQTSKAKALLSVPSVVRRLGVPEPAVRQALRSDAELSKLTGTPSFVRQAMGVNLLDLALDHPEVLKRLGLDPGLLKALPSLTRPALTDRLSLAFRLPKPPRGELSLTDVRVEETGIRVRLSGAGLEFP